jgi:hypothetical protein
MGYDDFEIMGMSALDPTPDEEAWEAYLDFAQPIAGGDDSLGLSATDVTTLEGVVGESLPWEIGLFLVLGVPAGDGWWRWNEDPAVSWERWQGQLRSMVGEDVLRGAPPVLPLFEGCAVPLTVADGLETNMANPILEITEAGVSQAGVDLAEWLHQRFDVPLPTWPASPTRTFPTWSNLIQP